MWKSIAANERTWVRFKTHFQEAYLDCEEPKQTAGAAGYWIAKKCKSQVTFMIYFSKTAARDAAFTELTTINFNLTTQLMK